MTSKTAFRCGNEARALNKSDENDCKSADASPKTIIMIHKIISSKKCGYKGKIKSTKRTTRNLKLPEESETAHRKDARRETTKIRI
jgi:hypothetical protein